MKKRDALREILRNASATIGYPTVGRFYWGRMKVEGVFKRGFIAHLCAGTTKYRALFDGQEVYLIKKREARTIKTVFAFEKNFSVVFGRYFERN